MKKGLVFDMDGTLWDSSVNVAKSWTMAAQKMGYQDKVITVDDMTRVMGKTMDVIADILFGELGDQKKMKLLDTCCEVENAYLREHGGVLYDHLEETLKCLSKEYPLYIVSNCQAGYIESFLDYYGFWKYFKDIQCYGDNLKQKGENIAILASRNELDSLVYVGDTQGDYDATMDAKKRLSGVEVEFLHARYGFGTVAEEVEGIDSFKELEDRFL